MINFYEYHSDVLDRDDLKDGITQLCNVGIRDYYNYNSVLPIILKDPHFAYQYARDVVKGRWPEAEPYILKDAPASFWYAGDIIKGRWKRAEKLYEKTSITGIIIVRGLILMINFFKYHNSVLNKEELKPQLEQLSNRGVSQEYTYDLVLPIIKQKPFYSYEYARVIIKGRWPEGEPIIMKSPLCSYVYAKNVIQGRFIEAEPIIMKNPDYAYEYAQHIIKGKWPEAEPYIIKDPRHAVAYAMAVMNERWLEAERYIMKDPMAAYMYTGLLANDLDWIKEKGHEKGRWPEAETYIKRDSHAWNLYREKYKIV